MNFRRIKFLRRKSFFGKLIRIPFKMIPSTAKLSIISGPLKGKKWIKGSHNISIILGTYEQKQTKEFIKHAKKAKVFWDLGAHVGYYSLLYKSINNTGKVFAFEPIEGTIKNFNEHMTLNKISDYKIFQVAVSDKEGELSFKKTNTTVAGRLDDQGDIKVKVIKLSNYLADNTIEMANLIKMDVEGAEVDVLKDLSPFLKQMKPVLFVSTHSAELHKNCLAILKDLGYQFSPMDSKDLATAKEFLAY